MREVLSRTLPQREPLHHLRVGDKACLAVAASLPYKTRTPLTNASCRNGSTPCQATPSAAPHPVPPPDAGPGAAAAAGAPAGPQ